MVQTRDNSKHTHNKEEIKKIGLGEHFKEIGGK